MGASQFCMASAFSFPMSTPMEVASHLRNVILDYRKLYFYNFIKKNVLAQIFHHHLQVGQMLPHISTIYDNILKIDLYAR